LTVNGAAAVPYPKPDANCVKVDSLAQISADPKSKNEKAKEKPPAFDPMSVEHCPDFDERMTLKDGRTTGIAYPNPGYNCQHNWSLGQLDPRNETPGRKLGDLEGTNRREDVGQRDANFMKPYINTAQLDPRNETPGRKLGDLEGTNRREDVGQRDANFMKPYINTAQLDPRYETPGRKLGDLEGTNRREDVGQRDANFMKPYINTA